MDSVTRRRAAAGAQRAHSRAKALADVVASLESSLPPGHDPEGQPIVVILSGVPGSGKSYLARQLQPRLPATIVETDHVRHALFHPPSYTGAENAWVYRVCHALIARLLNRGQSVIFDATNLLERSRRDLYRVAENAQARIVVVRAVASDAVIRQRLLARQTQADPNNHSDATVAVYDKLRQTEQPIHDPHLVIDTTIDVEQSIRRILGACHTRQGQTMAEAGSGYAVLDHTADLALQVWGDTLEELFGNAARGMFAQMAELDKVPLSVRREVCVEGDDSETLLVAWLSELLYLREVKREVYTRFTVRFPAAGRLEGSAEGGPCMCMTRPVKAVTYHGLSIERTGQRCQATIVFDV